MIQSSFLGICQKVYLPICLLGFVYIFNFCTLNIVVGVLHEAAYAYSTQSTWCVISRPDVLQQPACVVCCLHFLLDLFFHLNLFAVVLLMWFVFWPVLKSYDLYLDLVY